MKGLIGSASVAATTLALVLAQAPVALAEGAIRFASPTGSATGSCLSKETACTLERAVATAFSQETVKVGPGTYHPAAGIAPGDDVSIIGDAANRPVIDFGDFSGAHGLDAGGSLRNLVLMGKSSDSLVVKWDGTTAGFGRKDGVMERVTVIGTGTYPAAVVQYSTVLNSVFIGTANAATLNMSGRLIGSTVINANTDSSSIALASTTSWAKTDFGGQKRPVNLVVRNSIVRSNGGLAILSNNDAGGTVSLDADYVDVNTDSLGAPSIVGGLEKGTSLTVGAHVTTSEPLTDAFADPFDVHLPALSSVIDSGAPAGTAGVTAADLAGLDVYGKRRLRHGLPDIGAAEFQPPPPVVSKVKPAKGGKPGAWAELSVSVSESSNIVALLQRVRGSKATTVATLKSRYSNGSLKLRFRLKQGKKKLAKGSYRIAVTATGADGTASAVLVVPVKVG